MEDSEIYKLAKSLEEGCQVFWIPDSSTAHEVKSIGPPPPKGPVGSEQEVQEPSDCAYFDRGRYVALYGVEYDEFKIVKKAEDIDGWISINLNDRIRFQVTDPSESPIQPDNLGFVELTLWEFAQIYGPQLYHGNPKQPVQSHVLLQRSYAATPKRRYYNIVSGHTGDVIGVCSNAGMRDALQENSCTLVEITQSEYESYGSEPTVNDAEL
jgi:hypothetical protein